MPINLYNTLTRQKEEFVQENQGNVRMYVCGPTVYDRAHLGNARSVVVYDVLYRLLMHVYGEKQVDYVRNITDVDDKINKAAVERGITIQALTQEVIGWFNADMQALNCLSPTHEPKATEHIPQMIQMIEKLIANGSAYAAEGHVLFDVNSSPRLRGEDGRGAHDSSESPHPQTHAFALAPQAGEGTEWYYGILSHRSLEDLVAGARVEVAPYKKNPGDFVLWKPAAATDDASSKFESPWGVGRPGWHIECSAMATHLLGANFDIHGGGADLMFPHHENEIAQSCSANPGSHFAKVWVHNGFLTVHGEKMSKSLGNFITVRDLLEKGVHGEVIRFALLSTHYRKPLDWTDKLVEDAKKQLDYWYRVKQLFEKNNYNTDEEFWPYKENLMQPLFDDLNMSNALSELNNFFQLATKVTTAAEGELGDWKKEDAESLIIAAVRNANFLGLLKESSDDWFKGQNSENDNIQARIDARIAAKKAKNWKEADQIRDELKAEGILLEDKPGDVTEWRRA